MEEPRDARFSEARTQVQAMTVTVTPAGAPGAAAELVATPLLHYSDQQRGLTESTLWVWQLDGQPVLFSKLERLFDGQGVATGWQYCCTPTTTETVEIQSDRRIRWRSKAAALNWQEFDEAPLPGDSAVVRLRQLKALAAQFEGEIENTRLRDREQMRLLPQPLHRYESPKEGVIDGAAFGITSKGTNPDSLLLIEAVATEGSAAEWRFGIVGMTGDAVSIRLGDKVVFHKPFTEGPGDHRSWLWVLAPPVAATDDR
jgi:hypothetical protein